MMNGFILFERRFKARPHSMGTMRTETFPLAAHLAGQELAGSGKRVGRAADFFAQGAG